MHIMCVMFVKYSEPGVVALHISSIIKQLAKNKNKNLRKKDAVYFPVPQWYSCLIWHNQTLTFHTNLHTPKHLQTSQLF